MSVEEANKAWDASREIMKATPEYQEYAAARDAWEAVRYLQNRADEAEATLIATPEHVAYMAAFDECVKAEREEREGVK